MAEQNPFANMATHLKNLLNKEFLGDTQLMTSATVVNLAQGQTLFAQGEEAKSCFLVVSGSLKIAMKNKNAESVLTIISRGEIGGALLMGHESASYPGSVTALTQASVLVIPKSTYIDYWMKNPEALNFSNTCMRNRMRHLQEDKFLQLSDVEGRLIHFLHRHYLEKKDLVAKRITRKEIAMSIGAKTETVIRVLKKLERAGIIETQKSIISILDKSYIERNLKSGY